ncbi:hypothetical protein [Kitasatospora sp. NPDC051914]|uniref:hypothetical protein n=1 Tax=Kitasatospora sp. NPDC051914 TaxID=3154945 RepID=UPI003444B1CC
MTESHTRSEYASFASRVKLGQVLTESCSARRVSEGTSASIDLVLAIGIAPAKESVFYRLEANASLKDSSGEEVGVVEAAVVTRYDLTEVQIPTESVLQEFADREAVAVAYPYIRENIQSLAARVGFAGAVIPYLGSSDLRDLPHGEPDRID